MSDFDDQDRFSPFDSELGQRMRGLGSGHDIDADSMLESLRPKFARARSRRRAGIAASTLGGIAALSLAFVAVDNRQSTTPKIDLAATSTQPSNGGTKPVPSTTKTGDGTTTSTANPRPTTSTQGTQTPNSTDKTTQTSRPGGTTDSSTPRGSSTSIGTSTTVVTGPTTVTVSGIGGSVRVTWTPTAITARSYTAASGYTVTVKTDIADRYRVRFDNGSHVTDIDVRVHYGELEKTVDEI